jgi:hypothetical protein
MAEEGAPIVVGGGMKRFNNGHKCFTSQEAKFLSEIYTGEKKSQGKFAETMYTLRRPRDTIMGEATPRAGMDTTGKYFPDDKLNATTAAMQTQNLSGSSGPPTEDPLYKEFKSKVQLVDSLNRQRTKIEEELRVVNQVLHHKKLILGMSSGTIGQVNVTTVPK